MNIAITAEILSNDTFTGVELYTYNLIEALIKTKRLDLTLILSPDTSQDLFYGRVPIEIHNGMRSIAGRTFISSITTLVSSILNPPKCINDFDLIHCPTVIAPFFFRPKGKVIMTVHDLIPILKTKWHIPRRRIYFKYVLKHRFKYVDRFIAVSHNTKRDLINSFNIPPGKIDVIHLGVKDKFRPGYQKRQNFILAVGTLEPRKNFKGIIQSYIYLKDKYNIEADLVIVGATGWYFNDIIRIPEKFKENIKFKGYVSTDALITLYQQAKVFVYPSLYEGFGLPVLEAMASGCPVITSNVASLPEVAGGVASLVDPYDVKALAEAIYEVWTNPDLGERLQKLGLKNAQKFSWARCAAETITSYEKVLAS